MIPCPSSKRSRSWTPTSASWSRTCARQPRSSSLKKPPSCATPSRTYGPKNSSFPEVGEGRPDCLTGNEGWVPHCPDFLWRLVALIHSMRLSLIKGAHADLSSTAWQEIGVKPGFGLSGIPQHSTRLFCHPARRAVGETTCLWQVEKEMTLQKSPWMRGP